jgi:hypothetical protein
MTVDNSVGATVSLSGTAPSLNNLNILNGTLNVGNLALPVSGNIINNSAQIGSGSITITGAATAHTITSANGSFTNLIIAGPAATKTVTVTGNMSVIGALTFNTNKFLKIGSYQLTLGPASSIVGAGNTAFIKTNGVSSDLGVVKSWPVGTNTFTYAVGTRTNYTPVTITSLPVTTAGTLSIVPVDDQHPTADATGPQILNYYWIMVKGGGLAHNTTGTHAYQFPTGFIGGSGGTLIGAYLDAINLIGWTAGASFSTAGANTIMTFPNTLLPGIPTAGLEYHYTAGTSVTLPNPVTPVYSRFADAGGANPTSVNNLAVGGNWNLATNWTNSSTGFGIGLSTVPVGRPVVILAGARINMNISGLRAFTTRIDGLLVIAAATGHNLGSMIGTGTLRTSTSTLPAGNFTNFVAGTGGTIEYVGPMTMNNRSTYNNLSIIGTGNVVMTNTDLILNGNMTIGSTATLDNSANNRTISLARNWTLTAGGTFTTGTGSVIFNGSTASLINGANTFYNLGVAKTGGATATLNGTNTTTVNGNLSFAGGYFISTATNTLTLSTTATSGPGSATSFVVGPMRKNLAAAGTFVFPVGSITANRYRPAEISNPDNADLWTGEYVGNNPTTDGFSNQLFNSASVKKVSMFEYWLISRAGATTADLELTYNTGSYVPNPTNIGNVANLRVVRWTGAQWDFPPGAASFSQTGSNVTGTVTATSVSNFSPFTFGSLDADSPLPVKWGPFSATRVTSNSVQLRWITYQEINNDRFEIQRSEDGVVFTVVGTVQGKGNSSIEQEYKILDREASQSNQFYYRIRQIDYDGKSDYSKVVVVSPDGEFTKFWLAHPNPVEDEKKFYLQVTDEKASVDHVDVALYSAQGVLIYQATGTLEAVNTRLNTILQESRAGVYVLQVSNGTVSENIRIIRH